MDIGDARSGGWLALALLAMGSSPYGRPSRHHDSLVASSPSLDLSHPYYPLRGERKTDRERANHKRVGGKELANFIIDIARDE